MAEFGRVKTKGGLAGLRDLQIEDVPAIVEYWTKSPHEFLSFMGVDCERLGSEADITKRLSSAIRTGADQKNIGLAITLNGSFAGYTLLNCYSAEVNYSHWHVIAADLRGKGISTALYPLRIRAYFDVVPIARLIHQTRTRNLAVNRMLDKFVPIAETAQIENPDGVALPGEFHLRYVLRKDVPSILSRALELGIEFDL